MKEMSVSNTVSMLNNPNIFIGDSGASTHNTHFVGGIINIKRGYTNDSVMVGNGNVMTANIVGDLPGMICNRYGDEMSKGLIQEVTHCPSMKCNVFSITKLLLEG